MGEPNPNTLARYRVFADEYIARNYNGQQAAIAAGYSPKTAHVQANRLLKNAYVKAFIQEKLDAVSEATQITAEAVLQRWWELANADVNDLVQYRHHACRYCHGEGHRFQWIDEDEYWAAVAESAKIDPPVQPPSDEGGYGFKRLVDPHPDCPKCEGEGVQEVFVADTRKLPSNVKALYDGVKQTQHGLEVKVRDRDRALENVAKFLGMFKNHMELTSPDGSMTPQPTTIQIVAADDNSTD